jgi:hypothetical protein
MRPLDIAKALKIARGGISGPRSVICRPRRHKDTGDLGPTAFPADWNSRF